MGQDFLDRQYCMDVNFFNSSNNININNPIRTGGWGLGWNPPPHVVFCFLFSKIFIFGFQVYDFWFLYYMSKRPNLHNK